MAYQEVPSQDTTPLTKEDTPSDPKYGATGGIGGYPTPGQQPQQPPPGQHQYPPPGQQQQPPPGQQQQPPPRQQQYPPPGQQQYQYPPQQGYAPQQNYGMNRDGQSNQVPPTQAVMAGGSRCAICQGVVVENFSLMGIILAIICFPCGLICLFTMKDRVCGNCGKLN